MAQLRAAHAETPPAGEAEPGSADWCAAKLGGLRGPLAKYRFLTGDTRYDALLAKDAGTYMRFRMGGSRGDLTRALEAGIRAVAANFDGFTTDTRYTDRVLRWPQPVVPVIRRRRTMLLPRHRSPLPDRHRRRGRLRLLPHVRRALAHPAARYCRARPPPAAPAASKPSSSTSEHRPAPWPPNASCCGPAHTRGTLSEDGKAPCAQGRLTVEGPSAKIPLELPPRRLCILRIATE